MISVETTLSHIDNAARDLRKRQRIMARPLKKSVRHELAHDVKAKLTHPPADMSAMDGYAVKLADIQAVPCPLKLIGEARAGQPFSKALGAGEAVRIFTGGVIPRGADSVIIQENTQISGDIVTIMETQDSPRHIRRAGLDFNTGEVLISAGTRISPRHVAVAAAGNIAQMDVLQPLKIALLSNGDELKPVGHDLKSGQIINSNGPALTALLESWGAQVIDLGIAADNKDDFTARIKQAESSSIDADIIVPIGGASVGDHDLAKPSFTAQGYDIVFSKVAVRPGKPVWLAQKQGRVVLGLPGNPASALVCAHIFLRPLLGQPLGFVTARLSRDMAKNGPRESYMRGHAQINSSGQMSVHAFPRQDSGLITPFARANVLLRLPPHSGPWAAGDHIDILPLTPLIAPLMTPP